MLYTLRFFSSKCSLFHNTNFFGSCIVHILNTGCAEIKKKNNSGAKGLKSGTFPENRAVCEIMWENMVQPDRPQIQLVSWALLTGYLRLQTHSHNI